MSFNVKLLCQLTSDDFYILEDNYGLVFNRFFELLFWKLSPYVWSPNKVLFSDIKLISYLFVNPDILRF